MIFAVTFAEACRFHAHIQYDALILVLLTWHSPPQTHFRSVIPSPTRPPYTTIKPSSILLYKFLAIEHPSITFPLVMPSTIKGYFRTSAVDGGSVREASSGRSQKSLDKSCVHGILMKKSVRGFVTG